MLVQGLEPNTKYEFAVRLHVDQLSSPWSPVVYHSTLPEGRNCSFLVELISQILCIHVHSFFLYYVIGCFGCMMSVRHIRTVSAEARREH